MPFFIFTSVSSKQELFYPRRAHRHGGLMRVTPDEKGRNALLF